MNGSIKSLLLAEVLPDLVAALGDAHVPMVVHLANLCIAAAPFASFAATAAAYHVKLANRDELLDFGDAIGTAQRRPQWVPFSGTAYRIREAAGGAPGALAPAEVLPPVQRKPVLCS
jgi:hypothetical protein